MTHITLTITHKDLSSDFKRCWKPNYCVYCDQKWLFVWNVIQTELKWLSEKLTEPAGIRRPGRSAVKSLSPAWIVSRPIGLWSQFALVTLVPNFVSVFAPACHQDKSLCGYCLRAAFHFLWSWPIGHQLFPPNGHLQYPHGILYLARLFNGTLIQFFCSKLAVFNRIAGIRTGKQSDSESQICMKNVNLSCLISTVQAVVLSVIFSWPAFGPLSNQLSIILTSQNYLRIVTDLVRPFGTAVYFFFFDGSMSLRPSYNTSSLVTATPQRVPPTVW